MLPSAGTIVTVNGILWTRPLFIADRQIVDKNIAQGSPPVIPRKAEERIAITPTSLSISITDSLINRTGILSLNWG
jgi:hypothetical protein